MCEATSCLDMTMSHCQPKCNHCTLENCSTALLYYKVSKFTAVTRTLDHTRAVNVENSASAKLRGGVWISIIKYTFK